MTGDHRRAFLGYCAAAGLSSTMFPSTLHAQIRPGQLYQEGALLALAAAHKGAVGPRPHPPQFAPL